jgi:protein Tex
VDQRIADELGVTGRQVSAAVALFGGGATVPYITRYRKEATGMLDDAQLRTPTHERAINTGNEGSLTDT